MTEKTRQIVAPEQAIAQWRAPFSRVGMAGSHGLLGSSEYKYLPKECIIFCIFLEHKRMSVMHLGVMIQCLWF